MVWSVPADHYLGDGTFAKAVFSTEGIFVDGKALDPLTGKVLWTIPGAGVVLHPPGAMTPFYWAEEDGHDGYQRLLQLDPKTGRTLRTLTLPTWYPSWAHFHLAGALLLVDEEIADRLTAISLSDGHVAWSVAHKGEHLHPPVILRDRVLFAAPYVAYALGDGHVLWSQPGPCCTLRATPNGTRVFTASGEDAVAERTADGKLLLTLAGNLAAVSDAYVATNDVEGGVFAVYALDSAAPVLRLAYDSKSDLYSAIALSGAEVFYFHGADATLWRRRLPKGSAEAVWKAHGHFVLSTDATGVSPAYLGEPPHVVPPFVYLYDWSIIALSLPAG